MVSTVARVKRASLFRAFPAHPNTTMVKFIEKFRFWIIGIFLAANLLGGWGKWSDLFQDTAVECFGLPLRVAGGELPVRDFCPTYGVLGYLITGNIFKLGFQPASTLFVINAILLISILYAMEAWSKMFLSKVQRTILHLFVLVCLMFTDRHYRLSSYIFGYSQANIYAIAILMWLLVVIKAALSKNNPVWPWAGVGALAVALPLIKMEYGPAAAAGGILVLLDRLIRQGWKGFHVPFLAVLCGSFLVLIPIFIQYGHAMSWSIFLPDFDLQMAAKRRADGFLLHPTGFMYARCVLLFICFWLVAFRMSGIPFRFNRLAEPGAFLMFLLLLASFDVLAGRKHLTDTFHLCAMILTPMVLLLILFTRISHVRIKGGLSRRQTVLLITAAVSQMALLRGYLNGVYYFMQYLILPSACLLCWFFFRGAKQLLRLAGASFPLKLSWRFATLYMLLMVWGSFGAFKLYHDKSFQIKTEWGSFWYFEKPPDPICEAAEWVKNHSKSTDRIYTNLGEISVFSSRLNAAYYEHEVYMGLHSILYREKKRFSEEDERDVRSFRDGKFKFAVLKRSSQETHLHTGRHFGKTLYSQIKNHLTYQKTLMYPDIPGTNFKVWLEIYGNPD